MAQEKTIKRGDSVTVELLDRPTKPRLLPIPLPRGAGVEPPLRTPEPPALAYYDLGTAYRETFHRTSASTTEGDTSSGYVEISHETGGGAFRDDDLAYVHDALFSELGDEEVTITTSGRRIWSPLRFGTDPSTDGTFSAVLLKPLDRDLTLRKELLGITQQWSPRATATERVADINAQIVRDDAKGTLLGRQDLLEARDRAVAESNELWDVPSTGRIGKDATFRPRLLEGIYQLGFDSLRHYQPWDSSDEYITTAGRLTGTARAAHPQVLVGEEEHTAGEIFVAAQLHRFLLEWADVYIIGTYFFSSEVSIPMLASYHNRLPAFPYAYKLGLTHGANDFNPNDFSVGFQAEHTRAYGVAIAAGNALNVFSPTFFIILTRRVGGRWLLIQKSLPAGSLCAIVRLRQNGGRALVRYVWRAVTRVRDQVPIDFGGLSTQDVTPFYTLDSSIFDGNNILSGV